MCVEIYICSYFGHWLSQAILKEKMNVDEKDMSINRKKEKVFATSSKKLNLIICLCLGTCTCVNVHV